MLVEPQDIRKCIFLFLVVTFFPVFHSHTNRHVSTISLLLSLHMFCNYQYSTQQLQNMYNTAISSGALGKALYVLSGSSKMKFMIGTPTAGLAAALPTRGVTGSVSAAGITADADTSYGGSADGGSGEEFAEAPNTDDGNAPTDDGGASGATAAAATDDGGSSGDFRRLEAVETDMDAEEELAPLEATEVDVEGERFTMEETEGTQRNLKGVLVSLSPIPPRLSTFQHPLQAILPTPAFKFLLVSPLLSYQFILLITIYLIILFSPQMPPLLPPKLASCKSWNTTLVWFLSACKSLPVVHPSRLCSPCSY